MSIGSDINRIVAWTQRCSFAYHADEAAEVDALNDISCAPYRKARLPSYVDKAAVAKPRTHVCSMV